MSEHTAAVAIQKSWRGVQQRQALSKGEAATKEAVAAMEKASAAADAGARAADTASDIAAEMKLIADSEVSWASAHHAHSARLP